MSAKAPFISLPGMSNIARQIEASKALRRGDIEPPARDKQKVLETLRRSLPVSNKQPVTLTIEANKPAESNSQSNTAVFDKKAYQRELMRKRRAAAKVKSDA